ncbi:MAG: transporter substrate-binding domain-containing protein [Clostridiaceae bacterium]|nr:transporter substrate-binding domain-containing protein [Clostridiaceae bacterium]
MKKTRKTFRLLTLLLLVALAAAVLPGCAQESSDVLKVGMELAYPPFETKDTAGNPTGISVDIAKAFGESIGRTVEISNIAWDGLIPALQTGQVDMVISSMTITEERAETVDFSDPYAWAYLALLVNKESGIAEAADFNQDGMVLAAKKGTSAVTYTQNTFPLVEIRQFNDVSACVTEVSQGKADAFMYDQLSIYQNYVQYEDSTQVIYIPGQKAEGWGAAFKKGNEDLVAKMNTFIEEYRTEGGFDRLGDQYLAEEKAFFRDNNLKFFFEKP